MISIGEFQALRLQMFVQSVTELDEKLFMGRTWVGEAAGATEWLRPVDDPEHLGSLAIDLMGLELEVVNAILTRLQLPLRPGMLLPQVSEALETPFTTMRYGGSVERHEFAVGSLDEFTISCTFAQGQGLSYLIVGVSSLFDST